ncbi:MAG: DNA-3-methyladenine glycosylase I [Verrucomicrobiales bacterium]|nr:DNA-3-methyladenine glycosylase I [Verrucomicrobiales bacterium]
MSREPQPAPATPREPAPPGPSLTRCEWCLGHPLYVAYHDQEWGVPEHDDQRLFEKLILDGAQAGLSWLTILKKREGYRQAFDGFDAERMARYGPRKIAALLADPGIVRNRLKVAAAITNARAYLDLRAAVGSFDRFLWPFVGGVPRHNTRRTLAELPARTPESDAMSRALLERGFKFVGSTIIYAFMQAVGMVNDHLVTCFRHRQLSGTL